MKKQEGMSMIILIVVIVAIMIISVVIANYAKVMIEEKELQDLRTNMLFIQAEAKKGLEEVCFQTANLDASKEEDATKISQVKQENLKGVPLQGTEAENSMPEDIEIDENCYYLDEETLNEMGVKDLKLDKYGYFVVKYDFTNVNVEVISTKGYEGKYTLTQLTEE